MSAVEEHRAAIAEQDRRIVQCDERLAVNRQSAADKAHAAKVLKDSQAQKALDQLDDEHARVTRDRGHHVVARAAAQSKLGQAEREAAIEAERGRALEARKAWNATEAAMQEYADLALLLVAKFDQVKDAVAAVNALGFGPSQASVGRWAKDFLMYHVQQRRELRVDEADWVSATRRNQLMATPASWRAHTVENIDRVLGTEPKATKEEAAA